MKENITLIKAEKFALAIIELYKFLVDEKKEFILSKQVLRSGTSIGANVSEGECAISLRDLQSKLYIALKEVNETLYWLRLLHNSNYIKDELFDVLYKECSELRKMLTSSTKTISERLNDNDR